MASLRECFLLFAGGNEAGVSHRGMHLEGRTVFIVLLVVSLIVAEIRQEDAGKSHGELSDVPASVASSSSSFSAVLVGSEGLKLVLAIIAVVISAGMSRRSKLRNDSGPAHEQETLPLASFEDSGEDATTLIHSRTPLYNTLRLGQTRSNIIIAMLSLLFVTKAYISFHIIKHLQNLPGSAVGALSLLSSVFISVLSALLFCISHSQSIPHQQWLGIVLQVCGILSAENTYLSFYIPPDLAYLSVAFALLSASLIVLMHHIYHLHALDAPHKLNLRLFGFCLIVYIGLAILNVVFDANSFINTSGASTLQALMLPLTLHVIIDFAGLNVIFYYGPVMLGALTSLSSTFFLVYLHRNMSLGTISGIVVALLGFTCYVMNEAKPSRSEAGSKNTTRSLVCFVFLSLLFVLAQLWQRSGDSAPGQDTLGAPPPELEDQPDVSQALRLLDHVYTPTDLTDTSEDVCTRDPLPSLGYFPIERTYHHFDDVLLIVFFSHARYDVNLDYYKEVYAEFFPNMVFVGPKSREDKGFSHSYDVLVDSYESDEDTSDWSNYKMAGRMAHHMLYTVLTTPPYSTGCYKGFLWAPFDTLLNIPRLQQFDQSKIWYFSPWGEYVPNPAVEEEAWQNASNHAPPARISPDPETNFEETFRGWWMDWWWGDPHYGIPVCKEAFARIAPELRTQMASRFTDGASRYIGGSADTLYLPASAMSLFLEVLGTFLETSCFLEIAVPTAVHLVVPPNEPILFVDHWWIWEEPLNASFVRNVWAEGKEVDTFHTFHWGDKDADGVWHAIPDNIEDVRRLQRESAARQGLEWFSALN